jgi:putative ABC transport system permease protein
MNLAWADIRHHFLRFFMTAVGVGALLTACIGMVGLYRGIVFEALIVINDIGSDLWIVEGQRSGPFAERSEISGLLDRRLEGVPGVSRVRRFIQFNQRYIIDGRRLQIAVTALDYPKDTGSWLPLSSGRHLHNGHYEAIADESLGFRLGDSIRLGRDDYRIVGQTKGQVDISGDGLFFVTILDAQALDTFVPSEAVLLSRIQNTQAVPTGYGHGRVAAIMVTLQPGVDAEQVRRRVQHWGDVSILTREEEVDTLLNGRLGGLKIQILSFVGMTLLVTILVMSLSIYTMTIEKTHQIALLKLIGAKDRLIGGMIVQQALLIGLLAFSGAVLTAHFLFQHFPRTVLILPLDVMVQAILVLIISVFGSYFGIRKAMRVRAQEILS